VNAILFNISKEEEQDEQNTAYSKLLLNAVGFLRPTKVEKMEFSFSQL